MSNLKRYYQNVAAGYMNPPIHSLLALLDNLELLPDTQVQGVSNGAINGWTFGVSVTIYAPSKTAYDALAFALQQAGFIHSVDIHRRRMFVRCAY